MMNCALSQPEEIFSVAHVGPVVFPSNLLKVQGDKLRLVVVDCLGGKKKTEKCFILHLHATEERRWLTTELREDVSFISEQR